MKIQPSVALITFLSLAALSAAGFYVYQNFYQEQEVPKQEEQEENENELPEEEEILPETRILKDDFEITLSPGWLEDESEYEGILLMAVDSQEDVSSGIFEKLDFRTNLTIKSDDMAKYADINSLEDYVASVKISLEQAIPDIKFIKEEGSVIECESTQEDADFKTLLVFIEGNNKIIYAISFNAFRDSWAEYRDLFYQMAGSFKLRYNI